jgi:DNA-binding protein H-NS
MEILRRSVDEDNKIISHNLNRIRTLIDVPMEKLDLEGMPVDELWSLHEQISLVLSKRIIAEKRQLEERLIRLNRGMIAEGAVSVDLNSNKTSERPRRHYPRVFPKYQNPAVPSETWSGRGKQPRWLVSALKAGRTIDDFKIPADSQVSTRAAR